MPLDPRQGRADAVVNAAAEPEVLVVGSIWFKPVRIREARRIAVAGGEHQPDTRPAWNRHAADLDVGQGETGNELHRRLEAQYLLHHTRDAVGVVAQLR